MKYGIKTVNNFFGWSYKNQEYTLTLSKSFMEKSENIDKAGKSYQPLTVVPLWGIRPKQINTKEKIA